MSDLSVLYRAACLEGTLNLYASGPPALCEENARRFEDRFPGIEIALHSGYAGALTADIDARLAAGSPGPDVAVLQSIQSFDRWGADGVLAPFEAPGLDQVDPLFKAETGDYVGTHVNGLCFAYNSELLGAEDRPRSVAEFAEPRFRGKLLSGNPLGDDVTLYLYDVIVEKYGWGFLDRLTARQLVVLDGHGLLTSALAAGDGAATFDAVPELCVAAARRGAPIEMYFSDADPLPTWTQTAGMFGSAPHPHAAMLYLAWCLSVEEQQRAAVAGTWPVRRDIAPSVLRPLEEYRLAGDFRRFITDVARVERLRRTLTIRQRGGAS